MKVWYQLSLIFLELLRASLSRLHFSQSWWYLFLYLMHFCSIYLSLLALPPTVKAFVLLLLSLRLLDSLFFNLFLSILFCSLSYSCFFLIIERIYSIWSIAFSSWTLCMLISYCELNRLRSDWILCCSSREMALRVILSRAWIRR